MASIGENIRFIRKRKKMTLEQVAIPAGTDTGNLSRVERGLQGPTEEMLSKIADILSVHPSEFLMELGTLERANISPGPSIAGQCPLISWVQAGAWQESIDNFTPGDADDWMPCPVKHGNRTFVLSVRGPSMHNPHGSPVVVRLDDQNEATFKQLVIEGGRKYLRALNPAWPEQIIQINGNATICGVVIFKGERV